MSEIGPELPLLEIKKLLAAKNGDAALLYLYFACKEPLEDAAERLGWTAERLNLSVAVLRQLGLWQEPEPRRLENEQAPVYTEEDLAREYASNKEFSVMVGEAQRRLGRVLTTDELKILLSMYRYLGLSPEVISMLISYCIQRARSRGAGRMPSIRTIEKEAYRWADAGIDTMEEAAAYVQSQAVLRSGIGKIQSLLGLSERRLTTGEEKLITAWLDWGFGEDAIRKAYEKTCMNTGGLKWQYLHSILKSWHDQGLLTVRQIEQGDQPPAARSGKKPGYQVQHHHDALTDLEQAAIDRMLREED